MFRKDFSNRPFQAVNLEESRFRDLTSGFEMWSTSRHGGGRPVRRASRCSLRLGYALNGRLANGCACARAERCRQRRREVRAAPNLDGPFRDRRGGRAWARNPRLPVG